MEVSLLDMKGLPKGCLVSVRCGTQRCQAPADPDKLRLFFPKGAKEPFKVDLLAPLGSAEIKLQPGANAYPIQVPINGEIGSLTIGVREMEKPSKLDLNAISTMEYTKDDKGRPATPSTASRRHRLALQARTYLDEHQLLVFVQSLLQDLIRDKPTDPWEYINESSTTAKKLGVTEPYKPGKTPRDQKEGAEFTPPAREAVPFFLQMVAPNGMTWSEYVAPLRPVLDDAENKLTGPWLELMRTAVAFEHSTPDWSSQAEFVEADSGPAGMVHEFSERCGYGEFADALAAAEGELRAQYEAVGEAANAGTAAGEATPVISRPGSANIKSKELVLLDVNEVASSLQQVEAKTPIPFVHRPSVATWLAMPSPVTLKAPAAEKQALPDAQPNLRDTTLKAIEQASQDGTIDKLASQMSAMEQLRKTTLQRLLEAASDGSLLKVLPEAAASGASIEELQGKARKALLKASESGQLGQILAAQQKVVQAPAALSPELSSLRGEMKKLLVQAAENGTFEKALQDLRPSSREAATTLPWHPLPWHIRPSTPTNLIRASTQPPQEAELEEARARARDVLLQASQNGRLHDALGSATQAQPDQKEEADVDELRGMTRSLLQKAGQDGSLLEALQAAKGTEAAPEDEAVMTRMNSEDLMKMKAQEMLKQAGLDPRFLAALQEAAESAGLEFSLKPKPKASAAPSSSATGNDDVEELRAQARATLVEASLDGRFIKALEAAASEDRADQATNEPDPELRSRVRAQLEDALQSGELADALSSSTQEHDLCEGDEVIDRRTSRRYTVTRKSQTEVLLKAQDGSGNECWTSAKAVEKVPKLNLTAINLQREDTDNVPLAPRLCAPATNADVGEEVQHAGDPRRRGIVRKRTTTDICVRMEDGTEAWHDVDDLQQTLLPASDVEEGQRVVSTANGRRSVVKQKTQAEILVLHDDGSEEWLNAGNVGRVKFTAEVVEEDVELAKANAREALSAALFGSSEDNGLSRSGRNSIINRTNTEVEVSKENAREALAAALFGEEEEEETAENLTLADQLRDRTDTEVEISKAKALDALNEVLFGGEEEDEEPTSLEDIQAAKDDARDALSSALLPSSKEPASLPPPESQKQSEAVSASSGAELEQKIRKRNERFVMENESLKRENKRLQALLDRKQYADKMRAGPDAS